MDMADPIKVDSHVHLYRSKAEGQADKDGYEIWEYGGKSGVAFSDCFGTVDEVLTEMAAAGISKSVVVNLFVGQEIRAHMREALPDTLTASAREQANAEIEAEIADALGAFNRWICKVSRAHAEIVPFIGVDVTVLAGEPVATYVRDMVENHGGRGVKLHCASQKFSMSDERLWPMYAACEELGVAIIGHSGARQGRRRVCRAARVRRGARGVSRPEHRAGPHGRARPGAKRSRSPRPIPTPISTAARSSNGPRARTRRPKCSSPNSSRTSGRTG